MGDLIKFLKKRRISSVVLGGLLAASILCFSAVPASAGDTVSHWNWRSTEMPTVMGTVFDRFRAENPDTELQVEDINFVELIQKMELSARAGAMPDTFELWVPTQLARFAEEGWIMPLDDFIAQDLANGEDVMAAYESWADTTYKDHVYTLPLMGLTNVMAWNKTAFEAAGLPARAPETCDEMVDFARKLNNPPEMYGLGLNGNGPELWLSLGWLFYANEARIGRVDGEFHINSPEAVEVVQYIVDLANEGLLASFTSTDMQKLRTEFSTGKIAMIPDWNGVPSVIAGYTPDFECGVAKMPVCKTSGAMLMGGDSTYAISATSENPEASWKLIKHLTSFESQKLIVENWPFFITRKDVWNDVIKAGKINNADQLVVAIDQANLPNAYSPYREMPPALFEAVDAFRTELHLVVFGEKTAQEGMDTVAAAWEALYGEWEERYGELGARYY